MNIKKYLTMLDPRKKVMKCPGCKTLLRYPIKSNTTFRVTCPSCRAQFDISFRNPFKEVFAWQKGYGLIANLVGFKNNFVHLPAHTRSSMFVFFAMCLITVMLIFLSFMVPPSSKVPAADSLSPQNTKETLL